MKKYLLKTHLISFLLLLNYCCQKKEKKKDKLFTIHPIRIKETEVELKEEEEDKVFYSLTNIINIWEL